MKQNSDAFSFSGGISMPKARARYLAQAIQLEEESSSKYIRAAVLASVVMLVATIIWAGVTQVNEVAQSRGEVVPDGLIHNVQHLEGGIASEIYIRNGDEVKQGDLLIRFSTSTSTSEYEQSLIYQASLQMEAERLQAVLEHRIPEFGSSGHQYPKLAYKQLTIFHAQELSLESELHVVDAQIKQRVRELQQQINQATSSEKEIELLTQQVEIRSQLKDNNIISRTDMLSIQSKLVEMEGEKATIIDNIQIAKSALEEAKLRRKELIARFNKDIQLEAGRVASEIAGVDQTLISQADRVARLNLVAPVSGIVQSLVFNTHNAVIEPGQVILQIVPMDDDMIVESHISPEDIGHIHIGQDVTVKVDSYDFSRFGSVQGNVKRISASTYLDERHSPYYLAEIALDQAFLGEDSQHFRIIPGMTVTAEIKTGSKSILDYLLKPVSRGFDTAFQER